jgi:hypothetical protein
LAPLAHQLTFELEKAHDLLTCKYAPHLAAHESLQPDLVGLGGGQLVSALADQGLVVFRPHYRAVESAACLTYAAACRDGLVLVASTYLGHTHALLRCQANGIHQSSLKLLLLLRPAQVGHAAEPGLEQRRGWVTRRALADLSTWLVWAGDSLSGNRCANR